MSTCSVSYRGWGVLGFSIPSSSLSPPPQVIIIILLHTISHIYQVPCPVIITLYVALISRLLTNPSGERKSPYISKMYFLKSSATSIAKKHIMRKEQKGYIKEVGHSVCTCYGYSHFEVDTPTTKIAQFAYILS